MNLMFIEIEGGRGQRESCGICDKPILLASASPAGFQAVRMTNDGRILIFNSIN